MRYARGGATSGISNTEEITHIHLEWRGGHTLFVINAGGRIRETKQEVITSMEKKSQKNKLGGLRTRKGS